MDKGSLGEAKALAYLVENGYDVFTQFSGKAPFDFVAGKDGKLYRVEAKATTRRSNSGKWIVTISRTCMVKNKHARRRHFDKNQCDMLLVYIIPLDEIVELDPSTIENLTTIRVSGSATKIGES